MKIKLDENIFHHLNPVLKQAGYDVFTTADAGLPEKADVESEPRPSPKG